MSKGFTAEDAALLDELGIEVEAKKAKKLTALEERVIAGFEEIQTFVDENGRLPQHGEDSDIFERLYAVRLDRINKLEECRSLLEPLDHQNLLADTKQAMQIDVDDLNDDELLEELGIEQETASITELKHVRSSAEKKAAEDIANRQRCEDFEKFKPLFDQVQNEITTGFRITRPFERKAEISPGRFFIVGGQKAYVAEMDEAFLTAQGMTDARLRVIFDNGTESNLLMRSLQRALHKDDAGRRITEPSAGPLFSDEEEEADLASGTVYVLRSKSEHPQVSDNRDLLHKIGVTGGDVEKRIANAAKDPTFLLAEVEIVATYQLYNINRSKFENLVHRAFESARMHIQIDDRFGNPVSPKEWFLVPLFVIDEVIERFKDGSIDQYIYDPQSASLKQITAS